MQFGGYSQGFTGGDVFGLPSGGGSYPPSYGLIDSRLVAGAPDPGPDWSLPEPTSPDPGRSGWSDVFQDLFQTAASIYIQKKLGGGSSPNVGKSSQVVGASDRGELGSQVEPMPGPIIEPGKTAGNVRPMAEPSMGMLLPLIAIGVGVLMLALMLTR